ncbi:hypothetical protein [Anaplasma phagocytophilum]|uniref:Uncharacterized protein n=1 Tax=Anaplasma phagocytophilum str. CRT38 TaxID=1269275 RepID=S6GAG9_ANAPH|nr:hypothetical protein [Anaplasma phagocytophilum]EOA62198.1 hypothetical protein CRT38_02992 [Anaplasma phagocytophilum str. CRT38]
MITMDLTVAAKSCDKVHDWSNTKVCPANEETEEAIRVIIRWIGYNPRREG